MSKLKIAIVDDYLNQLGGAVQVVAALHEAFPQAPIYTIFSNVKKGGTDNLSLKFEDATIIPSWFNYIPFRERLMSPFLFLIPLIWASFDFSKYDVIISSASWAITKGFANNNIKEICYCHTPPRYLYGYDTSGKWKKLILVKIYAKIVGHFMRLYDYLRAQRVTQFVANSQEVARRIKKFYRRDSVVIHPPVNLPDKSLISGKPGKYFVTGGRLEGAKNFDLIVKVCTKLSLPLKVFGKGVEYKNLKAVAGPTIDFVGHLSEDDKFRLLAGSKAFILAAVDEDFGITPVESMAVGRPVIAFHGGGYLETVLKGKTGEFFKNISEDSLSEALKNFKENKYKQEDCRKQAERFSKEEFINKITRIVNG